MPLLSMNTEGESCDPPSICFDRFHCKIIAVVTQLREMKLKAAARKVADNIEEALTLCDFPYEHWTVFAPTI